MASVDDMNSEMMRIVRAKEARRRKLAALPFPEKVRAVITMQRMAVPLLRERNPRACIWQIEDEVD